MSLPRTYRLVAATVAVMLLFGGATPLIQHVCAQLGLDIAHVCCYDGDEHNHADDFSHADGTEREAPCHEDELDGPVLEVDVAVCCSGEIHEFDAPQALLPKQEAAAASLVAPLIAAVAVPRLPAVACEVISPRAPPISPEAPLFLLHEALLN